MNAPGGQGWHVRGSDGEELVFEIPGKVVVSIEPDGMGYSIFRDGEWRPGSFDPETEQESAAREIAEAAGTAAVPVRNRPRRRRRVKRAAS